MWVKIDDGLPDHPKVLEAAAIIGTQRYGHVRVLATFLHILTYCAKHLTGGVFPSHAVGLLGDRNPSIVLRALVAVELLERHERGYRVHDWLDHNPDPVRVKEARAAEARRKREARARLSGRTSARPSGRTLADASSGHAPDENRDPVPSRPVRSDQEQRTAPHRVAVRLAHTVLDELDGAEALEADLAEELKIRIARANLGAYDGRLVTKALESARVQRRVA